MMAKMARIMPPFLYSHTLHQDLAASSVKSYPCSSNGRVSDLLWLIKWKRVVGQTHSERTVLFIPEAHKCEPSAWFTPPPPSPVLHLADSSSSSSLDTHLRHHLCQAAFPGLPSPRLFPPPTFPSLCRWSSLCLQPKPSSWVTRLCIQLSVLTSL